MVLQRSSPTVPWTQDSHRELMQKKHTKKEINFTVRARISMNCASEETKNLTNLIHLELNFRILVFSLETMKNNDLCDVG